MTQPQLQNIARFMAALAVVGLVAAPVAASAATDSGTVRANVSSVISVSSTSEVAIAITPDANGEEAVASDTVTVDSNDADGYDLTLSNQDTTLTMTGYKSDNSTLNGSTLAAASGTYGTPAALGNNAWGWRVDDLGTFGAGGTLTYAGVPSSASPQNIRSTTTTASAQVTTVKYAAKVDLSVPDGVYRDTVTYTATAK